jgi:ribosomal protein S18 acetylase RimI-like enzyme
MNLGIRTVESKKDIDRLRAFMLQQPQFYPRYNSWVDNTCIPSIESGERQALIVVSDGKVVGDIVHRTASESPLAVEVKNFRIDPQYRDMYLGRFLLRQVERRARGGVIFLDVSVRNLAGVGFFFRNGFRAVDIKPLYQDGQDEYLMRKTIPAAA